MMDAMVDPNELQAVTAESPNRFKKGSFLLMRQCAAYASRYQTRHIALCDLSVAVYLDFAQLDQGGTGKKAGGFAGNVVLMRVHAERSGFHYALLAFFKRALDEWLETL